MSDTNPYAPPKITETGSPSGAYWQCYGERVMARNGAMLPKVDLETGVSEGEMRAVRRNYQAFGAGQFVRVLAFIGIYAMARRFLHLEGAWLIWALVGGSAILGWCMRMGNGSGTIMIWEFREAARERKRRLRRKLRFGLLFVAVAVVGVGAVLSNGTDVLAFKFLFLGLGLPVIHSVWAFLDRPKTRSESAPGGWLRIRNVHPEAMVKLRRIEAAELAKISPNGTSRRRRVFTTYYHKYPLPCLVGTKKNPLTILLIALVKFLPSKRLERESYDFTEARQIREDEAHEKLQERIQSWRAVHPDWTVIDIERLPSPAGDLMQESAVLASPDLAHFLCFHHSWLELKTTPGSGEFIFVTWLADEKMLCTTHKPLLPIDRPNVETLRAKGTEEEVFQVHLERCESRQIDAAADHAQVRERFQQEKKETAELLEKAGLRSPTREIG